jgi:hypothetical protein
MQRRLQLGVLLTAGTWLAGCSEDPDGRRFMPTGVVAVAGASGAGAGAAGASGGGSGGSAGGGNTGGMSGSGPVTFAPPGCTGCIELDVPVAPGAASLVAMFNFVFPEAGLDMSNATVTWRMSALNQGADFYVTPFAQNSMTPLNYAGVYRPQTFLTLENGFTGRGEDWTNVVLDLANTAPLNGAVAPPPVPVADAGADAGEAGTDAGSVGGGEPLANGGMDKSAIWQLGLQIGALASIAQATTLRILVDSVTIAGVDPNLTQLRNRDFSDGTQDFQANTFQAPPGTAGPTKY